MNSVNIKNIIYSRHPDFLKGFPNPIKDFVFFLINKILYISEINDFLTKYNGKMGIPFIDEIFERIDFSYTLSKKDKDKIPSEGRLVIIANHPLGGLDGLVLLKLISEIRPNVKILVNDILLNIDNLNEYFLPIDLFSGKLQKENLSAINNAVKNEDAIIVFPSGEVSRFGINGIQDGKWNKGALFFANKFNAPVLPVYIHAKNSMLFYFVSLFSKKLSMFLLPYELFNKKGKVIDINIGDPIPNKNLSSSIRKDNMQVKLLRKHHALIGKGKKGIFATEKNIIHPVDRKFLKKELFNAELLGQTGDGKKIFLLDYVGFPLVMTEIARLREITFRKIGEGTGNKCDTDIYDTYYKHILLWDDKELDIVGSYRIGICKNIIKNGGIENLYTYSLFNYSEEFKKMLPGSVELGRSFIQSKYWNTTALDYLWSGIGSFLSKHPETTYLYGPVSLSNSYAEEAKALIIYFYKKWFGSREKLIAAKNKFTLSPTKIAELEEVFNFGVYSEELKTLKNMLKIYGFAIPTLFKQYSDLCEPGGVKYLDFGIDNDFQNCIDGFILVNVDMIKEKKKERYIYPHLPSAAVLV